MMGLQTITMAGSQTETGVCEEEVQEIAEVTVPPVAGVGADSLMVMMRGEVVVGVVGEVVGEVVVTVGHGPREAAAGVTG